MSDSDVKAATGRWLWKAGRDWKAYAEAESAQIEAAFVEFRAGAWEQPLFSHMLQTKGGA